MRVVLKRQCISFGSPFGGSKKLDPIADSLAHAIVTWPKLCDHLQSSCVSMERVVVCFPPPAYYSWIRTVHNTLGTSTSTLGEHAFKMGSTLAEHAYEPIKMYDLAYMLSETNTCPADDHPFRKALERAMEIRGVRVLWWSKKVRTSHSERDPLGPPTRNSTFFFPPIEAGSPGAQEPERCLGVVACFDFSGATYCYEKGPHGPPSWKKQKR